MKRQLPLALGVFQLLLAWTAAAYGQGVLVVIDREHPVPLPRPIIHIQPAPPPASYKIKELSVQARVKDQVANVQVSQSFVNTGSRQMEVEFVFPLPYNGAVDRLTLMVDGKEYPAQLLPADKARSIYEGYVRRNQDPALLEWLGTGMFKTSVFPVPPGAERKVTLGYNQLLRKSRNLTDFLFPLSTAKYTSHPVEKVEIDVAIESTGEIKNVYSPTYSIEVKRPDKNRATVHFASQNQIPVSDFRLFYDVAPGELGASVISYRPDKSDDGFFLLLASPEIKAASSERPAKNVIFVVDRSGSMSGKKIDQAKEALKFVLNNLRAGDLFNIVAYDSVVESFRPEIQRYDDDTRRQALGFVEGLQAGGSTNIDGALARALGMLKDEKRPSFVIFLTDGLPTAGVTAEAQIVANTEKNNQVRARVISFGVGYDVNSRLLDRISRANYGQSEFVRPDEDIEGQVSRLYDKIASPVLSNVAIDFQLDEQRPEAGPPVNRVYPRKVYDLFEGEQLVLVGRYKRPGAAKVTITGKVGENSENFDFAATLAESSPDESFAFVEKLWALRRIGEIIDELDLSGRNQELIDELVTLATQHGILTPYTSFLADDTGSLKELADRDALGEKASRELGRLNEAAGKSGFVQRDLKKALQNAGQAGPIPTTAAPGEGGGLFGGASYRDIDKDEVVAARGIRQADGETLYKRNGVWIAASAADVDLEKEMDQIKTVERFSDDYFRLVEANTPAENRILALQQPGEELIVKLRSQLYRIK